MYFYNKSHVLCLPGLQNAGNFGSIKQVPAALLASKSVSSLRWIPKCPDTLVKVTYLEKMSRHFTPCVQFSGYGNSSQSTSTYVNMFVCILPSDIFLLEFQYCKHFCLKTVVCFPKGTGISRKMFKPFMCQVSTPLLIMFSGLLQPSIHGKIKSLTSSKQMTGVIYDFKNKITTEYILPHTMVATFHMFKRQLPGLRFHPQM